MSRFGHETYQRASALAALSLYTAVPETVYTAMCQLLTVAGENRPTARAASYLVAAVNMLQQFSSNSNHMSGCCPRRLGPRSTFNTQLGSERSTSRGLCVGMSRASSSSTSATRSTSNSLLR